VRQIDIKYNDEECSDTKREVWKYIPGDREITRTIHTKYAQEIYRRMRLPAFGKAAKMPSSATTTYGDEVFMEWNPMAFFTGTNKLHPTLQKFKNEFETNKGYVRDKVIMNPELTKYTPYYWNDNTQYELMTYIANNCKTVQKPPIWFRNQGQESNQAAMNTETNTQPVFAVSKKERFGELSQGSERPGTFSINRIKQKVDGTRERVENEVAFRLMKFNSLVGIRPDEIKRFICDHGIDPEMYMRVVIPRDKETGENRDRAFVNFKSQEDLDTVYDILSNQRLMFDGAIIEVQLFD
jgi:hypothetical protein